MVAAAISLTCPVGAADGGDRAVTQALLDELGRDTKHHPVTSDAMDRAANALERGRRMRVAGDDAHGVQAEALARQWAETARALVRAADAETQATELRRKALEAESQVAKTRELVEEVIARTGRLRAQIDAAEHEQSAAKTAVEIHDRGGPAQKTRGTAPTGATPSPGVGAP